MSVGDYCNREVNVVYEQESIYEAAQLMREYHVGDLVVVKDQNEQRVPVGIVTDRDIVLEIDAMGIDPQSITVGDAMSFELVTIDEQAELLEATRVMRTHGVRRLPVVGVSGELIGIITSDDVIELLAEQLTNLSDLISQERNREQATR